MHEKNALFAPEAITADSKPLPDRVLLYAPPKWGKTAFAAEAEAPVFLLTRGEDGLLTLKKSGIVRAEVEHFPRCAEQWGEVLAAIGGLLRRPPKTLVIDTLNGAEALCHAHVCKTVYGGDWGEKGFASYQAGYRVTSPPEFERLLNGIDQLRNAGTTVVCLCHSRTSKVNNPHGPDFDRITPALHDATWAITSRRFDVILAGTYELTVEKSSRASRGKAKGGERRVILAQPGAAHEAGGRYNLPPEIDCGTTAAEAWRNFQTALRGESEQEQ